MEKHTCKLCSRTFINGRALGGHMKAHLATLPLPPKTAEIPPPPATHRHQIGGDSVSSSSSSSGEEEYLEKKSGKSKSMKLSESCGSIVQDRESETESKYPTRKRSKRARKSPDLIEKRLGKQPIAAAQVEVETMSSVSNTSPDEDVAICLMMLSREKWVVENYGKNQDPDEKYVTLRRSRSILNGKKKMKKKIDVNRCANCRKVFRSYRALCSHERICLLEDEEEQGEEDKRIFQCPFCYKVFGSGQALGGHKRSHTVAGASSSTAVNNNNEEHKSNFGVRSVEANLQIDLNLPAPLEEEEEEEDSIVSDA